MSGVSITFGFDDGPIRLHLARLAVLDRRGYDRARREIGNYMVGEIQDNLSRQVLADGSPMPQSKAAIKRAGKTLIAKGHLRDSYVYQMSREGLEVGSAKVYAAIHHFGGATGRGHKTILPPRPVLGLTPETERVIGESIMDEIRAVQR